MEYKQLSSLFYSDNKNYNDIYLARYNSETAYRFNFSINNNPAFVLLTNEIVRKMEIILDKNYILKEKATHIIPGIAISQYTKKCLIDEIKMTNEIEGVYSTRKEIAEILNDKTENKKRRRLYGLVKKYSMLLKENLKLESCKDIRSLYDELVLSEVIAEDPQNEPDGIIFRKGPVFVQSPTGEKIHTGITPEEQIIEVMSECLNIFKNDEYNYLINIAVFHYMFGYIHPFYDGNGRTSRFISSYLLSTKLHFLVSYRISYTIKENIKSYYKSFKMANDEKNKGDLTVFVLRFFDLIIQSLDDLNNSLTDRENKLDFFKEKTDVIAKGDKKLSNLLFILVQNTLFGDDGLSVDDLHEICDTSKSKIRTSLDKLDKLGIIRKTKDSRKYLYNLDLDRLASSEEIE